MRDTSHGFPVSTTPPFRYLLTVLVALDRDALHINLCRRSVLVVERILRGRDVSGHFGDDAREGVARAVEMEAFDTSLPRILLQILNEAV